MVYADAVDQLTTEARNSNSSLRIIEYHREKSYIQEGVGFLQVINPDTDEFEKIKHLYAALQLRDMANQFIVNELNDNCSSRGISLKCGGYAAQNLVRNTVGGKPVAKPAMMKATEDYTNMMVTMTKVAEVINFSFVNVIKRTENKQRRRTFAQAIHEDNIFEAFTVGFYSDASKPLLRSHTDSQNCTEMGFQSQLVAATVFESKGKTVRLFFACYGRKCCNDYMLWEDISSIVATDVKRFLEKNSIGSREICADMFKLERKTITAGNGQIQAMVVHLDKAVHTSANVNTVLLALRKGPKRLSSVFHLVKFAYMLGLCSASDAFPAIVLDIWTNQKGMHSRTNFPNAKKSLPLEFHYELQK
jgi:hypothetical protein